MYLTPGYYRVSVSSSTVFPYSYGILEIIRANTYGLARFTRINVAVPAVLERSFRYDTKTWYDTVWRDVVPWSASKIGNDSDVSGTYISDALNTLNLRISSSSFTITGTLKSNISSSGNIFTQSNSDSRITSNTNILRVIFDDESKVTSSSITVTPGTGTITITGTTASFSGTIGVTVECYN